MMDSLASLLEVFAEVCLNFGHKLKKSIYTELVGFGEKRGKGHEIEPSSLGCLQDEFVSQDRGGMPANPWCNKLEFALSDFLCSKCVGKSVDDLGVHVDTNDRTEDNTLHPSSLGIWTRFSQSSREPLPQPTRRRSSDKTLVLDLDETLIHATRSPSGDADFVVDLSHKSRSLPFKVGNLGRKSRSTGQRYVHKRPYLNEFLAAVSERFEVVLFTAARVDFAMAVLDKIDPERKMVDHCLTRESCMRLELNRCRRPAVVKDLGIMGRPLSKVIMLDNSPKVYRYHLENGLPISSWYGEPTDRELLSTLVFLEDLKGASDVRDEIIRCVFTFSFELRLEKRTKMCLSLQQEISSASWSLAFQIGATNANSQAPFRPFIRHCPTSNHSC
ncbi:unnamed protein product [Choristocarpus tenellus]